MALMTAGMFAVSTTFPIVAGLTAPADVPPWMGFADVAVAAGLCASAIAMNVTAGKARSPALFREAYGICQLLATVPLLLIVGFFAAGNRIAWTILLIGLGWRAWLFVYTLPALLAGLASDEAADAVKRQ
jgi:hypothetical protein